MQEREATRRRLVKAIEAADGHEAELADELAVAQHALRPRRRTEWAGQESRRRLVHQRAPDERGYYHAFVSMGIGQDGKRDRRHGCAKT